MQALQKLTEGHPEDWPNQLPMALLMSCAQVNWSTGVSPFKLVYGTKTTILQTKLGPRVEEPKKVPKCNAPHMQVIDLTLDKMEDKQQKINMHDLPNQYDIGNKVWVLNPDKSKLQPEKVGPAIVMEVLPNHTYWIQGVGVVVDTFLWIKSF